MKSLLKPLRFLIILMLLSPLAALAQSIESSKTQQFIDELKRLTNRGGDYAVRSIAVFDARRQTR